MLGGNAGESGLTTILASTRFGTMIADSSISDDDRVWVGKKVWRIKGALVGMAGNDCDRSTFLDWYRAGMGGPAVNTGTLSVLILCKAGLFFYDKNYASPQKVESGREAIGTGAKAAMCAFEALNWTDPRRAVQIVCKHDAGSRTPVRTYTL